VAAVYGPVDVEATHAQDSSPQSRTLLDAHGRRSKAPISGGTNVVSLWVPPGNYVVFASLNLDNDDTVATHAVDSELLAGDTRLQQSMVRAASSGITKVDNQSVSLNGVYASERTATVFHVRCKVDSLYANVAVGRLRLTAIKVGGIAQDSTVP
jgi:hypothetical protein